MNVFVGQFLSRDILIPQVITLIFLSFSSHWVSCGCHCCYCMTWFLAVVNLHGIITLKPLQCHSKLLTSHRSRFFPSVIEKSSGNKCPDPQHIFLQISIMLMRPSHWIQRGELNLHNIVHFKFRNMPLYCLCHSCFVIYWNVSNFLKFRSHLNIRDLKKVLNQMMASPALWNVVDNPIEGVGDIIKNKSIT